MDARLDLEQVHDVRNSLISEIGKLLAATNHCVMTQDNLRCPVRWTKQ